MVANDEPKHNTAKESNKTFSQPDEGQVISRLSAPIN